MIDFVLPSLGADMDEGMLVAWLVAPGDTVHRGQVVAEIESDKGIVEVECWEDGVVAELMVTPGPRRLRVGTPLARLRTPDETRTPVSPPSPPTPSPPAPRGTPEGARHRPKPPPSARPATAPPVRHLARELGVDLARVLPTGPGGGITRKDVLEAAAARRPGTRAKATPMARHLAAASGVDLATVLPGRTDGVITSADLRSETPRTTRASEPGIDKAKAMRRAIARSMTRSKREIPHYYLATHVDVTSALQWLDERNSERPIAQRVLPAALLLKATALALRDVPDLNGHWIDETFHRSADVHLGVAVSLREGGLVAPAIHCADQLELDQMMDALRDLVARARTWRLRSSEMSDPTVTVTNLGDRGVEIGFPVIIPPQVAIVGFGRITERPVAIDGMLEVHPVVTATLAADHRVTNGHTGGLFLAALDRLLQEPDQL